MMTENKKIGLLGATGLVGQTFLEILIEENLIFAEIRLFASANSAGKEINHMGKSLRVEETHEDRLKDLDVVFICTGDSVSQTWAPILKKHSVKVVDNSAHFRMDPEIPLVIPEINAHLISKSGWIASPNCTTSQLVLALHPLQMEFGLESVIAATYQSLSGAGREWIDEHELQKKQGPRPSADFTFSLADNCFPQIGSIDPKGCSSEETKVRQETRKILGVPNLKVSTLAVRVPVPYSHSMAVWVKLQKEVSRADFLNCLRSSPGLELQDDLDQFTVPTQARGKNSVFVGRIHQDMDDPKLWLMWIVADNLRRGAAWNALQILRHF